MAEAAGAVNTAILVLGMHRSGTSALTRIINLLGADVGKDLLPEAADNRKGFWENRTIVNIHERLLSALDSAWDDPRPLPEGWEHSLAAHQAGIEIGQALQEEFAGASTRVIKDPRMCRLVPLWKQTLEREGIHPSAVLVIRDPDEVVGSLVKRNGMAPAMAALLWLRHVVEPLNAIGDVPYSVVLYDQVLSGGRATAERVGRELGVAWEHADAETFAAIDAFVEPSLRHQEARGVRTSLPVPWREALGGAYEALRTAASGKLDLDELPQRITDCCRQFLFAEPAIAQLLPPTRLRALGEQVTAMRARVEELESRAAEASDEAAAKDLQLGNLQEELQRSAAGAAAKDARLAEVDRQWHRTRSELAESRSELAESRSELAGTRSELEAVAAQLEATEQERTGLLAEIQRMRQSKSWQAMAPMRALAHRFPRSASLAASGASLVWGIAWRQPSRLVKRLRLRGSVKLIRASGLFDEERYLQLHADVRNAGMDPLWHFVMTGAREGRTPNALFDPDWYAAQTGAAPANALAHYIRTKGRAGEPHALFHSGWFTSRYASRLDAGVSPLESFFRIADDHEVSPHPLIDASWYLGRYPDVGHAGLNAALHFLEHGGVEGRDPSPLFMSSWYLARYQHLARAHVNPLQHYLMHGAREGLDPNPLFHTRWYMDSYTGVVENPLVDFLLALPSRERDPHPLFSLHHFREQSGLEGRAAELLATYLFDGATFSVSPHPLFDAAGYLARNEDVRTSGSNPLVHYLDGGAREGRDPNALFATRWYWALHREVRESNENPLVYYVTAAADQRGEPSPLFNRSQYMALHPELKGSGQDPLEHALHGASVANMDPAEFIGAVRSDVQRRWLGLDLGSIEPQRLAIGIVTYNNTPEQLDLVIRSIEVASRNKPGLLKSLRLYAIDNGQPCVFAEPPGMHVTRVESRGNVGFGRAHNVLMEKAFAAGHDAYIAFNPDGAFHPDALTALLEMHQACGHASLIEAMQFPEEHPKVFDTWNFDTPWASGACMFMPRAVHEVVGGFDDDFFMYCEDVDLSWRVRAAGMHVKICPRALFFHPVTDRPYDPVVHARFLTAGLILATKWGGDDFAAGLRREMVSRGMEIPDISHVSRHVHVESIADFDHLFSFARTRW